MVKGGSTQTLSPQEREREFDAAMQEIYWLAGRATGYWAGYFLRDVRKHEGLPVAKKLLREHGVSSGFKRLKDEGRLDLSVEALVLRPQFRPLFTDEELGFARGRLAEHGYRDLGDAPEADDASPIEIPATLLELVVLVEAATSGVERAEHRNAFAAFGPAARVVANGWLETEHLVPFSISVLERLGREDPLAVRALERYAMRGGNDQVYASAALDRLRPGRAQTKRK